MTTDDKNACAPGPLTGAPELRERLVAAGVERVRSRTTEAERRRLVEWMQQPG